MNDPLEITEAEAIEVGRPRASATPWLTCKAGHKFALNVPYDTYSTLPGLSASAIKVMKQSPLKYQYALTHPTPTTPALILGHAVHTAVLEPHKFAVEYAVWEEGRRAGKKWESFCAEADASGLTVIKQDEFETAMAMRDSVRGFGLAMHWLARGTKEVTMQWTDPALKRAFKARADWVTEIDGVPWVVDLKSTRDCNPFRFGSQSYQLGYHMQFALYADGYYYMTGKLPKFAVIAVESKPPYEPAVYTVPNDVLSQGREDYALLVQKITECEKSGKWPPAQEAANDLTLPTYAYADNGDDLSDLELVAE
jgi:hypothetical protein